MPRTACRGAASFSSLHLGSTWPLPWIQRPSWELRKEELPCVCSRSCHNPFSCNSEPGKRNPGHHFAFVLDLVGDYTLFRGDYPLHPSFCMRFRIEIKKKTSYFESWFGERWYSGRSRLWYTQKIWGQSYLTRTFLSLQQSQLGGNQFALFDEELGHQTFPKGLAEIVFRVTHQSPRRISMELEDSDLP